MTHSDPPPSPDYDLHELFREELGAEQVSDPEVSDPVDALPDDDRLYTDEFIRQNEQASRFLLLSVLGAGLMSLAVGGWYWMARNSLQPQLQQNKPLQVPAQPSSLPDFNSGSPFVPTTPNAPGQPLSPMSPKNSVPTDSGITPDTLPNATPGLPTPLSPNGSSPVVTPPPPPETP